MNRAHASWRSSAGQIALALIVLGWTAFWAATQWKPSAISWHFFVDGAHALVGSSGLHLYANNPQFQIGPITFLVTAVLNWLPSNAARVTVTVLMTLIGPLLVLWLAPLVPAERRVARLFIAALVVVPGWTVLSVRWAHLDDVLAMLFAVAAIRAVVAGRSMWAGLAVAAAIACKPWAVGFVPILLVLERRRLVAFGAAALGVVAAWAPFFIADSQTVLAFRPQIRVSSDSGLYTFGYRGMYVPGWGRTAQLLAAPFTALLTVLQDRWPALFVAAFAARLALEPQDLPYYVGAAVVSAVIFDLLATRWVIPWLSVVTTAVLWQPFVADFTHVILTAHGWSLWWYTHQTTVGPIHVVWAFGTIAFVLFAPGRWLGPPNRALPRFRMGRHTPDSAVAVRVATEPIDADVATPADSAN